MLITLSQLYLCNMTHLECHFLAKGRTNVELREKFILPEGTTQVMASFRYRGRPSSRGASPNRSTSSQSCAVPSNPAATSTLKVRGSTLLWELAVVFRHTVDWSFPVIIFLLFNCLSSCSLHCLITFLFNFFVFLPCSVSCSFWFVNPCLCFLICHCSPDSPTHNPQLW